MFAFFVGVEVVEVCVAAFQALVDTVLIFDKVAAVAGNPPADG